VRDVQGSRLKSGDPALEQNAEKDVAGDGHARWAMNRKTSSRFV